MYGIALADAKGTADFLGNDDAARIVHSSYNSSCFHISALLTIYDCRTIPVAVPGIFVGGKRLPHLPTAATRSGRFSRHRRRSHRSPVAFIYKSLLVVVEITVLLFVRSGDLYTKIHPVGKCFISKADDENHTFILVNRLNLGGKEIFLISMHQRYIIQVGNQFAKHNRILGM